MSHIVLTRPLPQAERFAEAIPDNIKSTCDILFSPLLDIKRIDFDTDLPDLDLIFTSENGVDALAAQCDPKKRRAFCVGNRTAFVAREAGFEALSANGNATDLVELIAAEGGGEMIYARGEHVARDLKAELATLGVPVREMIVYSQDALPLSKTVQTLIRGDGRLVFPLFSGRSMRLLVEAIQGEVNAELVAVCMSANVADAAPDDVFAAKHISPAPNSASLIQTLQAVIA